MFYIYLPFDAADLQHGASHFTGCAKIFTHGENVDLSILRDEDILYIFAHGRYSSGSEIAGEVKNFFGQKRTAYKTAVNVASELAKAGLPSRFRNLRCLVCWGGYVGGERTLTSEGSSHTLKRAATDVPFAAQLCAELKRKGYNRITVVGYTGSVIFTGSGANMERNVKLDHNLKGGRIAELIADTLLGDPLKPADMVATRVRSGAAGSAQPTMKTFNNDNRTVWY